MINSRSWLPPVWRVYAQDLALREHAQVLTGGKQPVFDEALSSFFRNVQPGRSGNTEVPVGDGRQPIYSLRARAVCVDMEEGVLNEVRRGPLGELFDSNQFIKDVSGSGNNWAHGHCVYGPQYAEAILESVRGVAEHCDSLQSFFLMHSLGGGTGSGLGTYILTQLEDHYPEVYRFNVGVFPSPDEDVVTSPYNSVLALNELREHSDCVLPIDNQALIDLCARMDKHRDPAGAGASTGTGAGAAGAGEHKSAGGGSSAAGTAPRGLDLRGGAGGGRGGAAVASTLVPEHGGAGAAAGAGGAGSKADRLRAFDDMNTVAAHLLTSLTASIRFPGALNVDLNEITMNLVPYPRMHFLVASMAPLYALANARVQPRSTDQLFSDVLLPEHHLLSVQPRTATYLACGLLARGPGIQVSDITRNVARIKAQVRLAAWNADGFKTGLCSVPPVGLKASVLALSNNSCVRGVFARMRSRYLMLYSRRAHLHHYTQYADAQLFAEALEGVTALVADYAAAERGRPATVPRLRPLG